MKNFYIIFLFISTHAQAQPGEAYLNQGEINGNPILIANKRILIDYSNDISFWDIDRSILLKKYSSGNTILGNSSQKQTVVSVSPKGNYFVTYTLDSLFIFKINTQQRIGFKHALPFDGSTTFKSWFSDDEETFIAYYEGFDDKRILKFWNTSNWKENKADKISGLLKNISYPVITVNGNAIFIYNQSDKIKYFKFREIEKCDSLLTDSLEDVSSAKIIAFAGGSKVLVYFSDHKLKQTQIFQFDLATNLVEERYSVPFIVDKCYEDLISGWLVFTPGHYNMNSAGFRIWALNVMTRKLTDIFLPKITEGILNQYCEFQNYKGHFLIRCSGNNSVYGINLSKSTSFKLNGFPKINWIGVQDDNIIYRTDTLVSTYTALNTQSLKETKVTRPYSFIYLNHMSITDSEYVIEKENKTNYILSLLQENCKTKPLKLIETKSRPLSIVPAGNVGQEYYFRFDIPYLEYGGDSREFDMGINDEVGFNNIFNSGLVKYLFHNNLTGNTGFIHYGSFIADKIETSEGFFTHPDYGNAYKPGYTDTLKLADDITGKIAADATGNELVTLYKEFVSPSWEYAENVHFNKDKSLAVLTIPANNLYTVNITGGKLKKLNLYQISNENGGTNVSISKAGFCNNDRNIYIIYTYSDKIFLDIVETSSLKHIYTFSEKNNYYEIKLSLTNASFLLIKSFDKVNELHNFLNPGFLKIYDWKNKQWFANTSECAYSLLGKFFYTHERTGDFIFYNSDNGEIINTINDSTDEITPVKYIADTRLYYINKMGVPAMLNLKTKKSIVFDKGKNEDVGASAYYMRDLDTTIITTSNNCIYFWGINGQNLYKKILLIDSSSSFLMDKNGYYSVSKDNYSEILYRKNNLVSPIQQVDLIYNRPSVFVRDTSNQQRILKKTLEEAYLKRLRKYGLKDQSLDFSDLSCDILNKTEISSFIDSSQIRIHLKIKGINSKVNSIHILDNDVPVFGKKGLKSPGLTVIDTTLQIEIQPGHNRIEIYGIDQNNQSSNRYPLLITSSEKPRTQKLYFVGIGINQFSDGQHNLSWSVKDIRNLVSGFKVKYGQNILVDTLFDTDVTLDKVAQLKKFLLKTTKYDKVIVAYSGHGLLSHKLDYYLSTYNIDFKRPEINGLPYEVFEDLLDSIPAREKLLLIDACHSGEVDKETVYKYQNVKDSLNEIKGVIVMTDSSAKLGMANSFEMMHNLFVDVGRNTGATIISAAAGTQFALEKGDLKNGVFTYAILNFMKQKKNATISELGKYVNSEVIKLTHGLQVPTARNENRLMDWEVW